MHRTPILALIGATVFASTALGGNCYLPDGSQYYLRAFQNGQKIDERGICAEASGDHDIPMNLNGTQFYISQNDWDWAISMAGKEILLVWVNKQTGQYNNLARF